MNIRDQQYIKVMNFSPSKVCSEGKSRGYLFPPARDDGPSVEYMSFQDIEYADSRSSAFTSGLLRFDDSVEDDVFSELKHFNWREKLWSEEDIDNVILTPTPENQSKIIAVKDILTIERIRGRAVGMINKDNEMITAKIVELINARFAEINAGKINSLLSPFVRKDPPAQVSANELSEMQKENVELKNRLAEMDKMVEQLMTAKGVSAEETDGPSVSAKSKSAATSGKQGTRPSKKTQAK